MWNYEKRLQFPVKISKPDPKAAQIIITQFGGPDIIAPIRFLREREIVHYQRFGESLRIVTDRLDSKNFYAFNPEFDNPACRS